MPDDLETRIAEALNETRRQGEGRGRMRREPNFHGADMEMLGHVAAFRERGQTEPHPDCSWCEDAQERGLWDAPLRRYRVTFYYEAEVEVAALDGVSARHRAARRAEPVMVESHAEDMVLVEAARRGDWDTAVDAYFAPGAAAGEPRTETTDTEAER